MTGTSISATHFRARDRRRVEIRAESDAVANSMEAAGIPARIKNRDVKLVGQVTGGVTDSCPYRNSTLIPEVADRVRTAQGAIVEGYKDHIGKAQALEWHYAVVSSGARINPGDSIKDRHSEIAKRITAFFRYALDEFGVELLLRSTEYPQDPNDGFSVHLHHNLIFWPHRELTASEWGRFRADATEKFGVEWHDAGKVSDPMRAVRYALKRPKLSPEMPPEVLRWLAGEIGRMKLVAFYNSLKHFAEAHRHQTYAYDAKAKRRIWVDKETRQPRAPRAENQADAPTTAPGFQHEQAEAVTSTEETESDEQENHGASAAASSFKPVRRAPWKAEEPENIIVGQTRVMLLASAWRESYLIVKNYQPTPRTRAGQARLAKILSLQAEARRIWDKNGAPPPEIALAISQAWLAAPSDEEAEKITVDHLYLASATLSVLVSSSIVIPSIPDSLPLPAKPPISPPRPLPDRAARSKLHIASSYVTDFEFIPVQFPIYYRSPASNSNNPPPEQDVKAAFWDSPVGKRHLNLSMYAMLQSNLNAVRRSKARALMREIGMDVPLYDGCASFEDYMRAYDAVHPGLAGPVPSFAYDGNFIADQCEMPTAPMKFFVRPEYRFEHPAVVPALSAAA